MPRFVPSLKKFGSRGSKMTKQVREAANKGGTMLPPDLKHRLETSLHQNLSDIRIYEDHKATLAGANAFSEGNDIFFAPGQYDPHSNSGYDLLSHEITHVVQQGAGHNEVKIPEGMAEVLDSGDMNQV